MLSVSQRFQQLRQNHPPQCALVAFITAGDPDLATTAQALKTLDRSGADIIELGVPYSDPLADGPVIQEAATRALRQGISLEDVLNVVSQVTPTLNAPIVLFSYYNLILNRGVEAFLQQIAAAGVTGLVVPDLPLEESQELLELSPQYGVEIVLLVAPTSSPERMKAIAEKSQGFIYLVSVTGVTGMRSQVESVVKDRLASLRQVTDKPIGIGFGISQPEQARQVQQWGADAVIVGSAFVKRLADDSPEQGIQAMSDFCQSLKQAISPQSSH